MLPSDPFHSTHWSVILATRADDPVKARAALGELFGAYWRPLYHFIRHRGHDPEAAEDLTQAFCARLLESSDLARVDPSKGKFRAFLLAACNHFLANEHDREVAKKRGGGRVIFSIELGDAERCYGTEPAHRLTPEALFTRRWAITLLGQALEDLRAECAREGHGERFEVLKVVLTGDRIPSSELASRLDLTVGAVQVAAHRLRRRYRDAIRARIAATVGDPSEIDEEIRDLFSAVVS